MFTSCYSKTRYSLLFILLTMFFINLSKLVCKLLCFIYFNKKRNTLILVVREEEENKLPELTQLFFSYVFSNLTHIAGLQSVPNSFRDKENLREHMEKRAIQTGRLLFSTFLIYALFLNFSGSLTNPVIVRFSASRLFVPCVRDSRCCLNVT